MAYLNNLSEYADNYITVPHPLYEKEQVFPIYHYLVFVVPVVLLFIAVAVLIYVWKFRETKDNQFTQKQLENIDLDLVNSLSNRKMLDVIVDLTRDSVMEVERENIELLDNLGEGNFGLVKKAVLVQESRTKKLVAVKMLKRKLSLIQLLNRF